MMDYLLDRNFDRFSRIIDYLQLTPVFICHSDRRFLLGGYHGRSSVGFGDLFAWVFSPGEAGHIK